MVVARVSRIVGRRIGWRRDDNELRVAVANAQLDRARRELDRDLLRGRPERVLKGETDRCVQRRGEALGKGACLSSAGFSRVRELLMNVLDVGAQIHDATMASSMVPCQALLSQNGTRTVVAAAGGRVTA